MTRNIEKKAHGLMCNLTTFGRDVYSRAVYYRKRGSASYIVREVRSVRERDTERERESETEVTSPLIVALKLARNFAPFVAKKNAEIGDEFCTFPCQKFAP